MADRFIGNRIINSLYPATGLPLHFHGLGTQRLERRATAARATDTYSSKLRQTGGCYADARTLEPVAVSIGPHYGTVGPFQLPGVGGSRWSAVLTWKRGSTACDPGSEGNSHA